MLEYIPQFRAIRSKMTALISGPIISAGLFDLSPTNRIATSLSRSSTKIKAVFRVRDVSTLVASINSCSGTLDRAFIESTIVRSLESTFPLAKIIFFRVPECDDNKLLLVVAAMNDLSVSETTMLQDIALEFGGIVRNIRETHERRWTRRALLRMHSLRGNVLDTLPDALNKARSISEPQLANDSLISASDLRCKALLDSRLLEPIIERCLDEIELGLSADRCAVALPVSTDLWILPYGRGFAEFEKLSYTRGFGLTGRTLGLPVGRASEGIREGYSHISSDDVHGDSRSSLARRTSDGLRSLPNLSERETLAFLGVPIYSSVGEETTMPFAALICCRFAKPNDRSDLRPAPFVSHEITHLQTISSVITTALDAARMRITELHQRAIFHQLTQRWRTAPTVEHKFAHSLGLLRLLSPFRRMLLTTVHDGRMQIRGRAVVGFEQSLISDTVRTLFPSSDTLSHRTAEPYSSSPAAFMSAAQCPDPHFGDNPHEDILSLYVRLLFRQINSADYASIRDVVSLTPTAWCWKHIDSTTAHTVGLRDRLALIPLITTSNVPVGVILAEYPSSASIFTDEDQYQFKMLSASVADLIEQDNTRSVLNCTRSILAAGTCPRLTNAGSHPQLHVPLQHLLEEICGMHEYSQALLFRYDRRLQRLYGMAGFNVNESFLLRECAYDASVSGAKNRGRATSFASAVFERRTWLFHWNVGQYPVDSQARSSLGISENSSAIGIPIEFAGEVVGVLIMITEDYGDSQSLAKMKRSVENLPPDLKTHADFFGVLISLSEHSTRTQMSHRRTAAEHAVVASITHLASSISSGEIQWLADLHPREKAGLKNETFNLAGAKWIAPICEGIRDFLDSDLCGLFLSERPVRWPTVIWNQNFAMEPRLLHDVFYQYCGGAGYTESARSTGIGYWLNQCALTTSALRSRRSQSVDDITDSKVWSKGMRDFIDWQGVKDRLWQRGRRTSTSIHLNESPRSFMGVPITFREGDETVCYGVITVTRIQSSSADCHSFSGRDVLRCEDISQLLGLGLSGLELRQRSFSRFLQRMSHDYRAPVGHLLMHVFPKMSMNSHLSDEDNVELRKRLITEGTEYARMADLIFVANSTLVTDGTCGPRAYLEDVSQTVIRSCECVCQCDDLPIRAGESTLTEIRVFAPEWSVEPVMGPSHSIKANSVVVRYGLYELIRNAVRSVRRSGLQFGWVRPFVIARKVGDNWWITIEVEDSGDPAVALRRRSDGESESNRGGMGLEILNGVLRQAEGSNVEVIPAQCGGTKRIVCGIPAVGS